MKKNPRLYYCCKCHGDLKFEKEIWRWKKTKKMR
jgi:hypothetical protein